MNNPLSFKSITILVSFVSIISAQIGDFSNSGRVVDENGNPVADAFIRYMDESKRFITTFSDADGNFPAATVGVRSGLNDKSNLSPAAFTRMQGSRLFFRIDNDKTPVTVSLYSVSGKKIMPLFKKRINSSGYYSINAFGNSAKSIANGIYLIRGKIGPNSFSHKICRLGIQKHGTDLERVSSSAFISVKNLDKAAAVDQIRVGKTGYSPSYVDIDSYDEDIGTVTINSRDIEGRIDDIMSGMSLDQKIAQMAMAGNNEAGAQDVGTFLWGAGAGTSADEYNSWQGQWMSTAPYIPLMGGYDNVHGVIEPRTGGGTILPHNSGMGCITDTLLIQKAYRMTAIESAAKGCYWTFGPCIAVSRDEHWGRIYESPGEDPELVARYARHAVLGLQGRDLSDPTTIAATLKHFAGDGGTNGGTNAGDCATGSDEVLRSIHLPPFQAGIEAGAATVMPSFSKWRNIFMHCNQELLTNWLKGDQGFQGFIVGDWGAHEYQMDYANTLYSGAKEGTRQCILAGLDNPMAPGIWSDFRTYMAEMVPGDIPESRVNDAVRRMIRVKLWMGLFDNHSALSEYDEYYKSAEHWNIARECVRKSMVLLKNDNSALPLSKSANITTIGKWSNDMGLQCGGWTLGWKGGAAEDSPHGTTLYEALNNLGSGYVTYSENGDNIQGDAVVIGVGLDPDAEYTKTDDQIRLESSQYGRIGDLMNKAKSSGKTIILVLFADAPVVVTQHINDADAVVCAWMPGVAGEGMADVLYGDYDFEGRLAWTWPASIDQIPINNGNYGDNTGSGGDPLYEFGYGLTY